MSSAPESIATDEWKTPAWLLELVREFNGGQIGLDPASGPGSLVNAVLYWTKEFDGLLPPWGGFGLVYVNPPCSRGQIARWMGKCAAEGRTVEIIALPPVATATRWWQEHVTTADAICFLELPVNGSALAVCYWGPRRERFRRVFAPLGWTIGK